MLIKHRLPDRPPIESEYCRDSHSLTRIIDSTIQTIYMKDKKTIADLSRLSMLDDESFALMAYLQKAK